MHEAMFYVKLPDKKVRCHLCPHRCTFSPGQAGLCRVRLNKDGTLIAGNYGKVTALGVDPIEKKPLYHFYPGKNIFSAGTVGCNFHCEFCQNWGIAHGDPEFRLFSPGELVELALRAKKQERSIGIAYTYSEPGMWYEFMLETAQIAHQEELVNVMVTNGFIQEDPLRGLLPFIDAFNIDVKGFTNEFYRKVVRGAYEPVLKTAELAKKAGKHVEITTLLIPGLNDSEQEIEKLVRWIATSLGRDVPLHFSRYFPNYKMQVEPTPVSTLQMARQIGQKELDYVYLGNVWEEEGGNTYCPECGCLVVRRSGYRTSLEGVKGKECARCGRDLAFVGLTTVDRTGNR